MGFGLSLLIEGLQYIFGAGTAEIDDLLHNTAGAAFGYGIHLIHLRIIGRFK